MEPITALILKIDPKTLKVLYIHVPRFKEELSLKSILISLCMEHSILSNVDNFPCFWFHYMIKWHPETKLAPIKKIVSIGVINDDPVAISNVLRNTRWRVRIKNVVEYLIDNKINILNKVHNATNPDDKLSFNSLELAIKQSILKGNIETVYACMKFIDNNYSTHFDRIYDILKHNFAANILYVFREYTFKTNFDYKTKKEIIMKAPSIFGIFAYNEFLLHLVQSDESNFIKWLYLSNRIDIEQIRETYCMCIDKIKTVEFYLTESIATAKDIANSFRNTSIINFDFLKALKVLKLLDNRGENTKDLVERLSDIYFK